MKMDVFNINDFVKANKVEQVSNPSYFLFKGRPTPDGLFSEEIFGMTEDERKVTFGYIDLNGHFIHPLFFSLMQTRMGSMRDLLSGKKYAIIENKKIMMVPDDYPGAETGIEFLFENFDKIDWIDEVDEDEIDSIDKKNRLKLFRKLKRDEFFVDKWLVLPPGYRAINMEDVSMGDEINKLYKDLISKTNSLKSGFGMSLFGNETRMQVQNLLLSIFNLTIKPMVGKGSLLRNHLLGKTIDYTSSNVITSPGISMSNNYKEMPVTFGKSLFPIATLMSLFHPFFVKGTTDFLHAASVYFKDVNSFKIKRFSSSQFSSEYGEKMIKAFIKTESERFNPVIFEYYDKDNKKQTDTLKITLASTKEELENGGGVTRDFTWTDLFFAIAKEILVDKYVYVTRYPITNFQNIFPTGITIQTTSKTQKVYVKMFDFIVPDRIDNYPYVKFEGDPNPKPNTYYEFINVFVSGNIYLKAMGGDYDGDMLYMRGLFTKEANDEAKRLIKAKTNILGPDGFPSRGIAQIGKDAAITLYTLTKD